MELALALYILALCNAEKRVETGGEKEKRFSNRFSNKDNPRLWLYIYIYFCSFCKNGIFSMNKSVVYPSTKQSSLNSSKKMLFPEEII